MNDRFSKSELESLKRQLQTIVAECQACLGNPHNEIDTVSLEQSIGRVSRIDSLARQQIALANRKRRELLLAQAKAALARIEIGEYGDCQNCGEEILLARLQHNPASQLCLRCQQERERSSGR